MAEQTVYGAARGKRANRLTTKCAGQISKRVAQLADVGPRLATTLGCGRRKKPSETPLPFVEFVG